MPIFVLGLAIGGLLLPIEPAVVAGGNRPMTYQDCSRAIAALPTEIGERAICTVPADMHSLRDW